MFDGSTTLASLAITQLWQLTALILVVFIATRWLAKSRPHLAYVLWLLVLIKAVTPPVWSSQAGVFSQIQASLWSSDVYDEAVGDEPTVVVDFDFAELPDGSFDTSEIVPYVYEATDEDAAVFATTDGSTGFSPGDAALACWAILTLAVLAFATFRYVHCLRRLRQSAVEEADGFGELLTRLSIELGVRRRVKLLITSSRVGPAVVGLLRPMVVLPELVLRGKRPEDLEPILAHELIHVRRGDLWLGALQVLAKALWWFHPLVWWSARVASREAERCCDEQVIAELGCDPKRYARSLLEILELKQTLQPIPTFPGMKPVEITSQRMERIMKLGQGCHKRTPWWCWIVMLIAAVAVLPGSALVVGEDDGEDQKPSRFANPEVIPIDASGGDPNSFGQIRSYPIADVLAHIQKDTGCDESGAMQTLLNVLRQPRATPLGPVARHDAFRISHETLLVVETEEGQQRVESMLESIRKFGMTQIGVELRFVTASTKLVDKVITEWELAPMAIPAEESTGQQALAHRAIDKPLPSDDSRPRTKAGVVTETRLPAIYKVVDDDAVRQLLTTVRGSRGSNILFAPKVTLFNGQSATISDSSMRPFVVGIDEGQPQIRVVKEGMTVRLRPLLRGQDLWLDYEIDLSRIKDVREQTLKVAGQVEPLTLQVPEVRSTRIDSSAEFALGKSLVIGGLQREDAKGKPEAMLVMLRAYRIDPQRAATAATKSQRSAGRVDAAVAESNDLLPPTNGEKENGLRGWRELTRNRRSADDPKDARRRATVPILGPITTGGPPAAINPPSDDEVLRAMAQAVETKRRGVAAALAAFDAQLSREDVRVVKEKIADYVDPPKFLPGVGPAQLHHAHYKCTIYFDEVSNINWPIPHKRRKEDATEVVYIDHAHFHLVKNVDGADTTTKDSKRTVSFNFKQAPLGSVLKSLAKSANVNLVIDDSIHMEGVSADTEVTAAGRDLPFRQALQQVLKPLRLTYRTKGEVVEVISEELLTHDTYPKVYNVADIVVAMDNKKRSEGGKVHFDVLIESITQHVAPELWDDVGGPGAIEAFPTNLSLVVSQSQQVHQQVAAHLNELRGSMGLDPQVAGEPKTARVPAADNRLISKVYAVAELVIPPPSIFREPKQGSGDSQANAARPDFETLVDLITSTIRPTSWSEAGGSGRIQPMPANLSLVVQQTRQVHEEIADLLRQLRKLQEVQVTIDTRLIGVSDSFFERASVDHSFEIEDLPQPRAKQATAVEGLSAKLSDIESFFLLQAAQADERANLLQAPKVTLFNGQSAGIDFGGTEAKLGRMVQFQPVVSNDRESVRLMLAVGEDDPLSEVKHAQHFTLANGQAVLVDVTGVITPWKPAASTIPKIPYVRRLFRDSPRREKITRTFLLITPKIVVVEEEEELLGIDIDR